MNTFYFSDLRRIAPFAIVCGALLLLAGSSVRAQDNQPAEVIKVYSNLVSVPVIVSDRNGRYIPGLKQEDFKLFDNNTQRALSFFDAAEEPLNVALLLDTSRSTQGVLDDIKKAAKNFLKELRPQDRAMIVCFDYGIHKLSALTSDRKVLEQAIKHAEVGEFFGTLLNDAVLESIERDLKSINGRKAIILLTDGEDAGSRTTQNDLISYAAESDAMIYSIYYESSLQRPFGRGGGRDRGRGGIFGGRGGRGGGGVWGGGGGAAPPAGAIAFHHRGDRETTRDRDARIKGADDGKAALNQRKNFLPNFLRFPPVAFIKASKPI
jgi:uncharacterized membrane protein YgcG